MKTLLLVLALLLVVGCTRIGQVANGDVIVAAAHTACTADADCVYFNGKCNSCECGTPINRQYLDSYQSKFNSACKDRLAVMCDMYCPLQVLKCVNSTCAKVEEQVPTETEVSITEEEKACQTAEECTTVMTRCSQCDCGSPIAKIYQEAHQAKYTAACSGYQGPACDTQCAAFDVDCKDSRCAIVLRSEANKTAPQMTPEESLDVCETDSDCIIVPFRHCCGATKKAINKKNLDAYNAHPEWQKFDNPDTCAVIGMCADDSKIERTSCKDVDGILRCSLINCPEGGQCELVRP